MIETIGSQPPVIERIKEMILQDRPISAATILFTHHTPIIDRLTLGLGHLGREAAQRVAEHPRRQLPRGMLRKVDTTHVPLSAYLGAVGMPGVTAWVKLGQPLLLSNLVDASNSSVPQQTQA